MSDEFNSYRKTLDSVCGRMIFFEFSSSHFSRKWKLLGESMEMSEMTLRIEWKCSRVLAGPPSGRNPLVKCGLDTSAPFFRVSADRKLGKWEVPKKMLAIQSELFLSGWNRAGVNRWPGGRAVSGKRPGPPRKPRVLRIA